MNGKNAICHIDSVSTLVDGEWICKPVIFRETEKAVCFQDGGQNVWIPRKCIASQGVSPYGWYIEVPFWIAKEKGLSTRRPDVPMVY